MGLLPKKKKVVLRHTAPIDWTVADAEYWATVCDTPTWKKLEIILHDQAFNLGISGRIDDVNGLLSGLNTLRSMVPASRRNKEMQDAEDLLPTTTLQDM